MDEVTHHGRRTAFLATNQGASGPTLCYIHGSGGNHRIWNQLYGPNGTGFPSVALDLSGHGESDDVATKAGPETLAAYREDVLAVALETDADVLVGNSLGGAVVLSILLEEDYKPDAVVLAGTGAKLAVHEDIRTLAAEDFEGLIDLLHAEGRLLADSDPRTLERSRETMRETGRAVTERDLLTAHSFDVRDRLDEITTPALALVGREDRLTPPDYHDYFARELPDCEYVVIDDAAHLMMVDRPVETAEAVRSFCTESLARG